MPGERWPEGFARGHGNRRALLVLASLRGLTPRALLDLAQRKRSAAACLAAIRAGGAGSEADQEHARTVEPEALEAALAECGARMVEPGDDEYAAGLEELADPPAALFVRGRRLEDLEPRVAVVGARNCSALGRDLARSIGRGVASAGVCVVSGAARGIDTASHQGALSAGGPTIGVLGSGIDVAYPRRNGSLIAEIEANGAVVSEYAPGVPAEPFRFPARNRIIAALGRAVVIVEGADGSGSLITADHALDLGRAIFALPGSVTNPLAAVPLALIRDGATMIRGAEDLLQDLELAPRSAEERVRGLSIAEQTVISCLAGPTLPEHVARTMNCGLPDILPLLLQLEMKGLVRSVGGRFESRVPVRS